ncbi:MAG: hypothetical protein LQ345_003654 [Seirophora villosa]|nr:MAG: hypothetical protein LQ345_003654 [Seirophora villosa]
MFRKPRTLQEASESVKPSTGRPPTPPSSTTPKLERRMESIQASEINSPPPLLGRSRTTPRNNGKSNLSIGARSGGKSNGSILSFFKKADIPSTNADPRQEEDGLFLASGMQGVELERPTQMPTPPREHDADPLFAESLRGMSPLDDTIQYNEVSEPRKRRRTSAPMDQTTPLKPLRRGPFVDESDDEKDLSAPVKAEPNGPPEVALIPTISRDEPSSSSLVGEGDRLNKGDSDRDVDADDGADTTTPAIPTLKHEPTSHADGRDFDGMDDFIDDEFSEGEEYMERRWMEEQAELEVGFEDGEDSKETPGVSEQAREVHPPEAGGDEGSEGSCPICGGAFGTLSEQDASKHVNDCLDGKAPPLAAMAKTPKAEQTMEVKQPISSHKRFQRAAIAKPGQENPFDLAVPGAGGSSAFSKLMSGHAEDAAWATAAATENASRGKPAYQRTCPFYKILPGFNICVDAFRYGAVEGCKAYFLSHFHSDHYVGLTSSWCHGPIYCSRVTGNLVRRQLRVDPKWVVDLEFDKKIEVPGTQGAHVTMIPANHCPGSSLYLYEKVVGKGKHPKVQRVLHCGDFRACPAHVQHPLLRPEVMDSVTKKSTGQQKLDVCYLDTTYLTPKYAFPSQEEVIKACADMCVSLSKEQVDEKDDWEQTKKERAGSGMVKFVRKEPDIVKEEAREETESKCGLDKMAGKKRGRLLVIVGTYSIGKERICLGVAKALNSKIYATPNKQKICAALEDAELMARLTNDPLEAQVHMQMLMEIRAETLADYLTGYKPHFSRIVGFRPSGWNYRPPNSRFVESPAVQTVLHSDNWKSRYTMAELVPQRGSTRESQCFGVPYSEHSSFRELTMFCCALRIDKIIPTVNVGSAKSRERMKGWCEKWGMEKKKNGLFKVADGQQEWS